MRKFSSYGPVDKKKNYYVKREDIIDKIYNQLIDGHYMTVWAPRQCGKTWIMNEVFSKLLENDYYNALIINLENLKVNDDIENIIKNISERIITKLKLNIQQDINFKSFDLLFKKEVLKKPLILILDEFDALDEKAISFIVSIFRYIYMTRLSDNNALLEKEYLLHGVALIGVRSVIGIENVKGSPFNIQRSVNIPNLTYDETKEMFKWYEKENDHIVEQNVVESIYKETCGQPGLVSWFGELITEGYDKYEPDRNKSITIQIFEKIYSDALYILPNNNILNIISKAKQQPYNELILDLFKTREPKRFMFDDNLTNYLYMNGVIDKEETPDYKYYTVKFSSPFVQKRLFNYFANEYFKNIGDIFKPFEDVSEIITNDSINISKLLKRYENYLKENRHWILKNAPRRSDLKIYEAIYHFNLYEYLINFFGNYKTTIWPEFPTGNGKVDLMIQHFDQLYALEIKSYKDKPGFEKAIKQAAKYAGSLNLDLIYLVVFVEYIDEKNRSIYEKSYYDQETDINIETIFIEIGSK